MVNGESVATSEDR